MTPIQLRNMARGGRGFHANRSAIIKSCLGGVDSSSALNDFLLHNFFRLPETGWGAFAFVKRDWELADLLVGSRSVQVEKALLAISAAYIRANADSVAKLYAMADTISGRLLKNEVVDLAPGTDMFTAVEAQSLFAFRVVCGSNQASAQAIKDELEETLVRGGWSHTRLMYPMINLVVHGRSADELDEFLSYFATGNEVPAEMLAIKLLLSDTAARNSSLAFKIFVGLMGHPFDLCDILLDHVEYACLAPDKLPNHLREALDILVTLVPSTRVRRVANAVEAIKSYHAEAPSRQVVERALEPYGVGREEADLLSRFVALAPLEHEFVADATRPLTILANMRAAEYPEPGQFRSLAQTKAICVRRQHQWHRFEVVI